MRRFSPYINVKFGIGTFLTNNIGIKPMQIVIKMFECNNKPVIKISDDEGKQMSTDIDYLNEVKKKLGIVV